MRELKTITQQTIANDNSARLRLFDELMRKYAEKLGDETVTLSRYPSLIMRLGRSIDTLLRIRECSQTFYDIDGNSHNIADDILQSIINTLRLGENESDCFYTASKFYGSDIIIAPLWKFGDGISPISAVSCFDGATNLCYLPKEFGKMMHNVTSTTNMFRYTPRLKKDFIEVDASNMTGFGGLGEFKTIKLFNMCRIAHPSKVEGQLSTTISVKTVYGFNASYMGVRSIYNSIFDARTTKYFVGIIRNALLCSTSTSAINFFSGAEDGEAIYSAYKCAYNYGDNVADFENYNGDFLGKEKLTLSKEFVGYGYKFPISENLKKILQQYVIENIDSLVDINYHLEVDYHTSAEEIIRTINQNGSIMINSVEYSDAAVCILTLFMEAKGWTY